MGNWEYKKVYLVNSQNSNLNEFGGLGWELCAAIENLLVFKRPMLCINCKNYKEELIHIRCSKFYDKKCLVENKEFKNKCGCEKFKSKD